MGIVLARIDNPSSSWYRGYTVGRTIPVPQRIMIIDDTVANNELTKASMKLARPTGMGYFHHYRGNSFK